jgi:protease-4
MGRVAGSGGYWITCIGQPIVAEVGTITGSIGVLGVKANLGPLFRRVGIQEEVIALDASAEMNSPTRGWTDGEKQQLQGLIDDVYRRFLGLVAKSRGMKVEEVEALAGGRVYAGNHAAELRLVDRVGGLDEAIAMAKKAAKVEGDLAVTHLPKPRSFFDTFAEELLSVRALVPEGPVRLLLRRLGPAVGACAVLQDALAGDGTPKVWALTPDLEVRF